MTSPTAAPDGTSLPDGLSSLLKSLLTPCALLDASGHVLLANDAGMGVPGLPAFDQPPPDDWPAMRDAAPAAPASLPASSLPASSAAPAAPPRRLFISRIGEGSEALFLMQAPVDEAERATRLGQSIHDVRTELQTIVAATEMLGAASADIPALNRSVSDAARQALALITAMLDQTRADYSAASRKDTNFSVAALLHDTVARLAPLARQNGNRIVTEIADRPDSPSVSGPVDSLEAIVRNLLSNAAKFTQAGTIRLTLAEAAVPGDPNRRSFTITVADTGIGISATDHARFLAPFQTGNNPVASSGTGIGTYIIQQAIAALEGQLDIESRPGEGARFTVRFTLPVAIPETAEDQTSGTSQETAKTLVGTRVLIVEDNGVNRALFQRALSDAGAAVTTAAGGQEAFELLSADTAYDLVLLDLSMPGLDGFALVIRLLLRDDAAGHPCRLPRIVALTGHDGEHWNAACTSLGIEGMIEKPISTRALCEKVAERLATPAIPQARPGHVFDKTLQAELREDMGEEVTISLTKRALDEARGLYDQILNAGVTQGRRDAIHSALGSSGLTGLAMVEHALRVIQAVSRLRPDDSPAMCAARTLLQQAIEQSDRALSRSAG